jgi:hypothetical protein
MYSKEDGKILKKKNKYTGIALLSLPFSQFIIINFELRDTYISAYWALLGFFCFWILLETLKSHSKNISTIATLILNFCLGIFGITTSSIMTTSYFL